MKKSIVLFIAFVFLTSIAWSQANGDYRSNAATGNWGVAATWQRYDGGGWVAATEYPGLNTGTGAVEIRNGHTITLNQSIPHPIGSLFIDALAGNANTTLVFGGGFTLNVSGDIVIIGGGANSQKGILMTSGAFLGGSTIQMGDPGSNNRACLLNINGGIVSISGNITMQANGIRNSIITGNGGTLSLGGSFSAGSSLGKFDGSLGNLVFFNSANQTLPQSGVDFIYNNITLLKPGGEISLSGNVSLSGTLTLSTGKINTSNFKLILSNVTPANQLSGGNANSYIYSTGAGRLVRQNMPPGIVSYNYPLGTANYYLPVTILPTNSAVGNQNIEIKAFQGISTNGVEGGPQFSDKSKMVDAVWTIDRTAGTGTVGVTLQWNDALEGSEFSGYPNNQIGMTRYSGIWNSATSSMADAANNRVTESYSSFSPFAVTQVGYSLPLKLLSFDASTSNCSSLVKWKTTNEVNVDHIELQVSYDNNNWSTVQTIAATNNPADISNYSVSFNHGNRNGNKLLRLKMVDIDGKFTYSKIISVQCGKDNVLSVYPNPATNSITLTGTKTNDRVQVIGMDGRTVLNLFATEGNTQLSIESLASGTYQIRVLNNTKWKDAGRFMKL